MHVCVAFSKQFVYGLYDNGIFWFLNNNEFPQRSFLLSNQSLFKFNLTLSNLFFHRHEARDIVRNAVHASEDDAVIFVGSGCTGAVHKLVHAMDFASDEIKPIVLVGPYEHHSNLLPWREIGATVSTRNSSSVWCIFVYKYH